MTTPFVSSLPRIPGGHRRSAASAVVWLAVASGTETVWSGRRLVVRGTASEDEAYCPVHGEAYGTVPPPSWIVDGVAALDGILPPEGDILDALSPRDLVLPPDPPASRIPQGAEVADAAACILACRMIAACRRRIVPPAFTDSETALSNIVDAGYLAALAGGDAALAAAVRMAAARGLFARMAMPFTEDLDIEE